MPLGPHNPHMGAFEQCLVQEGYGMIPAWPALMSLSVRCKENGAERCHKLMPADDSHEEEGASVSEIAQRLCSLHGLRPQAPLPPAFLDLAGLLLQHGLAEHYAAQAPEAQTALQGGCTVKLNARQRRTLRRAEERANSTAATLRESAGHHEKNAAHCDSPGKQRQAVLLACDSTNGAKPQQRLSRFAPAAYAPRHCEQRPE